MKISMTQKTIAMSAFILLPTALSLYAFYADTSADRTDTNETALQLRTTAEDSARTQDISQGDQLAPARNDMSDQVEEDDENLSTPAWEQFGDLNPDSASESPEGMEEGQSN